MSLSTFSIRIVTIIFLILVIIFSTASQLVSSSVLPAALGEVDGLLTVAFLDVGQGDAIFIETPDGAQVLIDGGPDGSVVRELSKHMPFFDRTLDVVLATHSDKDHIGGLIEVLERYEVETIIRTENKNDTEVAALFDTFQNTEDAAVHFARGGQLLQLGASTTLLILSPEGDPTDWESNTASIVAQLQYGESTFMLTGDAGVNIEEYLSQTYGELLQSDVLKLGHHGSRTSSGEMFLDTVSPQYGIVSAAADNSYGHPHREVVENLNDRGIEMLETASVGTVVFKSDGRNVWREE